MVTFLMLRALKTALKIISVSKSILLNRITFYPKQVLKLEESFRQRIGVKYAISFSNGTSALEAAIYSLRLDANCVALVQADTFHASVGPIYSNKLQIRYLETGTNSYAVTVKEIIEKSCKNTKLIVLPHLFGLPQQDIVAIKEFCLRRRIYLIEDCSHCHFGKFAHQFLGTFGDISVFSLQGSKAIAGGEGGILCTNSHAFAEVAGLYGHFGRPIVDSEYRKESEYAYNTGFGSKRRIHPLAADLALVDLQFIDYENKLLNNRIREILVNRELYANLELPKLEEGTVLGGLFYGLPIFVSDNCIEKIKNLSFSDGILKTPYFNLSKNSIYKSRVEVENINDCVFFLGKSTLMKSSSAHLVKKLIEINEIIS